MVVVHICDKYKRRLSSQTAHLSVLGANKTDRRRFEFVIGLVSKLGTVSPLQT